jgi:hypothetical protein
MTSELRKIIPSELEFLVNITPIDIFITFSEKDGKIFEPNSGNIIVTMDNDGFIYLDFSRMCNEKKEDFADYDYGYDKEQIQTIMNIMNYFEENKEKLIEMIKECEAK